MGGERGELVLYLNQVFTLEVVGRRLVEVAQRPARHSSVEGQNEEGADDAEPSY